MYETKAGRRNRFTLWRFLDIKLTVFPEETALVPGSNNSKSKLTNYEQGSITTRRIHRSLYLQNVSVRDLNRSSKNEDKFQTNIASYLLLFT